MSAYNIIKELVGSREFYENINFYRELSSNAQKPVMCESDGSGLLFKKGEVYQSLNCSMIEFELNGVIHSYYVDEWYGYSVSKMTKERADRMQIVNSLKFPYVN